jgi:hypothetical protein
LAYRGCFKVGLSMLLCGFGCAPQQEAANPRPSRVILRKSRIEQIWSGLHQIATVNADIA